MGESWDDTPQNGWKEQCQLISRIEAKYLDESPIYY